MSINVALKQLLEAESSAAFGGRRGATHLCVRALSLMPRAVVSRDTLVVGVARVGTPSQQIVAGTIGELLEYEFGEPLHSLVIVGQTHIVEQEFLDTFMLNKKE